MFSWKERAMIGNARVSTFGLLLVGAMALTQGVFIQTAWAQEKAMNLFKIVTVKDEIVIGLTADELGKLGGQDAGAVAKALVSNGEMTVWQYAVRKNANGDLEQAPLRQVGLLANNSLRVEPYASPLKVLPHE
jgi:hypothetical protein